jgi:hypothetical protein
MMVILAVVVVVHLGVLGIIPILRYIGITILVRGLRFLSAMLPPIAHEVPTRWYSKL